MRALFALLLCLVAGAANAASASKWWFRYSPGMPSHPAQVGAGFRFAFPAYGGPLPCRNDQACASVHYLTTPWGAALPFGGYVEAAGQISVTRNPVFHWQTEPGNGGSGPARFHFMVEAQGDGCLCKDYGRWWSVQGFELKPGAFDAKIAFVPSQWQSVFGHLASSSSKALAGFKAALAHPAYVGMTFGGGNSFGHGVNVRGGSAAMTVSSFHVAKK